MNQTSSRRTLQSRPLTYPRTVHDYNARVVVGHASLLLDDRKVVIGALVDRDSHIVVPGPGVDHHVAVDSLRAKRIRMHRSTVRVRTTQAGWRQAPSVEVAWVKRAPRSNVRRHRIPSGRENLRTTQLETLVPRRARQAHSARKQPCSDTIIQGEQNAAKARAIPVDTLSGGLPNLLPLSLSSGKGHYMHTIFDQGVYKIPS